MLLPQPNIVAELRKEAAEPRKALELARYRAEWYRRDLREKEREDEEHEKERVAYAQIDWHDFTVVESIDYQPWEEGEFPAPTTPEEVGARSLFYERMLQEQQAKQKQSESAAAATEADDITVEMEIDEEDAPRPDSPRREDTAVSQPPMPPSIPAPILNPAIPGRKWNIFILYFSRRRSHGESEGVNSARGSLSDARFAHAACHRFNRGTVLTQGFSLVLYIFNEVKQQIWKFFYF